METVVRPLPNSFVEVGVFVGFMLALFTWLHRRYGCAVLGRLGRGCRVGPLLGAFLGVVPGCGGAIVVMPMYVRGSVSFGTVVAALVATMGDSSFVLIAADPALALTVHALLFATGVASGTLVDLLRIAPHCRPAVGVFPGDDEPVGSTGDTQRERPRGAGAALWLLLGAGLVVGVPAFLGLTQPVLVPTPAGELDVALLVGLAGLAAAAWVLLERRFGAPAPVGSGVLATAGPETAFVTVLVAGASLATSLAVEFTGLDLGAVLGVAGLGGVLAGAAVGLVPGCAPQILLTGLYVSGTLPVPTLMANAASQDGDALFPLLAMARRPALVAAGLTTVPGLATGGAWLLLS